MTMELGRPRKRPNLIGSVGNDLSSFCSPKAAWGSGDLFGTLRLAVISSWGKRKADGTKHGEIKRIESGHGEVR